MIVLQVVVVKSGNEDVVMIEMVMMVKMVMMLVCGGDGDDSGIRWNGDDGGVWWK